MRPVQTSVVIPVHNGEATLPEVLRALQPIPADWEIVVVDDHSTDATAAVAASFGATVVSSDGRRSDSMARNSGARRSTGEILVFLDADVVVPLDVLRRAVDAVASGAATCLFAIYDRGEHFTDLVSRYKNYWIRHTTRNAPRPYDWLNTSCVVLRRGTYEAAGGFREFFHRNRGGGDLAFGHRVREAVGPVDAPDWLVVKHLKTMTLRALLRNDFNRARGFFSLAIFQRGLGDVARRAEIANIDRRFSAGVLAAGATVVTAPVGLIAPQLFAIPVAYALFHFALLVPFLAAARRERIRGWWLFPPILWLDQLACALGLTAEIAARLVGRRHPLRQGLGLRPGGPLPSAVSPDTES